MKARLLATHTRFGDWALRRRLVLLAGSLLVGGALSACGASSAAVEPQAAVRALAIEPTAAPARMTPRVLEITPVPVDLTQVDPAFEPIAGARALWGTDGGSMYQIEVPDNWNGEVVFYAHGFRGAARELTISPPPIREHLISGGFAWAASSFSANGYEPGIAAADTLRLKGVFAREVGQASRNYLYGQSMGGHVVAHLMEQQPTTFDGALSECGSLGGSEILDYFLSWGLVAGHMAGLDLSLVADDGAQLARDFSDVVIPRLGRAAAPTREGEAFASVIERLTGGDRPFFREGYEMSFGFNFGILAGAAAAPGAANAATQNTHVTYDIDPGFGVKAEELNKAVPRVEANAGARDRSVHPEFADNTGRIERPVLTIHDTGDLFVPISLEQTYRRRVDAAGRGDLLVQRAIRRPGHCNFSEQERESAFDDMIAWARGGAKPAGDDLLGDLTDIGRVFTFPLEPGDPGGASAGSVEVAVVD